MSEHKIITCQLTSKPDPLAVSERGKIYLQIQETGAEKKRVQSLLLTVPCGKGADAVFQSTSGVWIRTEDSERWECGQDRMREEKSVDTPAFLFIDSMEANGDPMESPAVFQITGDVPKEQGSALISIIVTFADGTKESSSAHITKGDGELYLENFLAARKVEPEVPTAVFRKNEPIYFSWNSNGVFFKLYAFGVSKPLAETTDTTFVLEGGAREDTTYILQATKPSAFSDCLYRTLTVHITDPSLESLEIREQLKTDKAALTVFGEPSVVSLQKVGEYTDWTLVPETDGYLVGKLAFQHGVTGNGTLTVKECSEAQAQCYEVSDMAFQGKIVQSGNGSVLDLSKKASLCVPVRKGIIVMVSLLISHISQANGYDLSVCFIPLGKGRAVEI